MEEGAPWKKVKFVSLSCLGILWMQETEVLRVKERGSHRMQGVSQNPGEEMQLPLAWSWSWILCA